MRMLIVGVLLAAVACGGGGGGGGSMAIVGDVPPVDENPPAPQPTGPFAPVLREATLRQRVIEQDGDARWVIDYRWADADGDLSFVVARYPGIDRDLSASVASEVAGETSGSRSVGYDIPDTDEPRSYAMDLSLIDTTGLESNSIRLNYTLVATSEPPPGPAPVDPVPTPSPPPSSCCRTCCTGQACGDSCISRESTCSRPRGCACQDRACPVTRALPSMWELDGYADACEDELAEE